MAGRMPPPGEDGHGVAIIIGAPKGGRMPPPGEETKPAGKASREDAGFVGAEQHCIDCSNYDPQTGDCSKVEGSMEPDSACLKWFTPVADEEDSNEGSPTPEASSDDMPGGQ